MLDYAGQIHRAALVDIHLRSAEKSRYRFCKKKKRPINAELKTKRPRLKLLETGRSRFLRQTQVGEFFFRVLI